MLWIASVCVTKSKMTMTESRIPYLVHDLVPVLAGEDLEDGEKRGDDRVEVGGGSPLREVEASAEELHAEQGEDEDEEGEEQQEREDGTDGVHQCDHEVAQIRPVLGDLEYSGGGDSIFNQADFQA